MKLVMLVLSIACVGVAAVLPIASVTAPAFNEVVLQVASPTPTASLESRVSKLEAQQQGPEKDFWDRIESLGGMTGILVAIVGVVATYLFNKRQQEAEIARDKRHKETEDARDIRQLQELKVRADLEREAEDARRAAEAAISAVQVTQTFMPQLQSEQESDRRAALSAIVALGKPELAVDLAVAYGGPAAIHILGRIASGTERAPAERAEKALEPLFRKLRTALVTVTVVLDEHFKLRGFIIDPNGYVVFSTVTMHPDPTLIRVDFLHHNLRAELTDGNSLPWIGLARITEKPNDQAQFPSLELVEDSSSFPDELFVLVPTEGYGYLVRAGEVAGNWTGSYEPDSFIAQIPLPEKYGSDAVDGAPVLNKHLQVVGIVTHEEKGVLHIYSVRKIRTLLQPALSSRQIQSGAGDLAV